MTYNELIIPDLASTTLKDALTKAIGQNEVDFHNDRQMLIDFLISQQHDQDRYLKIYFNGKTRDDEEDDYPHNLILTQCNITQKIVKKKARNYTLQPIRKIDGKIDEYYDQLLIDGGIKSVAKQLDRFNWLLGDNCIIVSPDANLKRLQFHIPAYYRPFFSTKDNYNPIAVMYPIGLVANKKGEMVQAWYYIDDEKLLTFEESTWEILKEEENEVGLFYCLFTHRLRPFLSHWTQDAQDLVDTNRDINVALTAINNAFRIQGFPNLAAIGVDPNKLGEPANKDDDNENVKRGTIKIRWDKLIAITADVDGKTVDLKYLHPSVDWDKLIGTIKSRIELMAYTWNISVQWTLSGDLASGVALKILNVDNTDDVNDMAELYEEFFEIPMFNLLKAMSGKVEWMKEISGNQLTLDWQEESTVETPTEEKERLTADLELGLTNYIDILRRRNPDLDNKAAIQQLVRNFNVNRIFQSQKGTTGEIFDALMKGDTLTTINAEQVESMFNNQPINNNQTNGEAE